jgi:hypothetical protein
LTAVWLDGLVSSEERKHVNRRPASGTAEGADPFSGAVYVFRAKRANRPFGGRAPPAALYYASRERRHEHPVRHLKAFSSILQADAYNGYNELYDPARAEGPITSALCWAYARRQFFELADIAANARRGKNAGAISPIALEAVRRIDALFEIERDVNGVAAAERPRIRKEQIAPAPGDSGSLAARATWPPVALALGRRADRLYA